MARRYEDRALVVERTRTTWCVSGTGHAADGEERRGDPLAAPIGRPDESPTRRFSTAISPRGVAMRVPSARQIGHGGGPDGVRDKQ